MVKKFTIPFASQGDANDIPDALQVDGKVSFTQGFGYDYERPYDDPQAKDIAREDMNGLFKAITSAVGELQTLGASEWSNAIAYPKGAIVYHEKDLYISQIDDNQNTPPQNWVSITSIANDSLKKAANLSDLTNKATARSNLGLGSSATLNKTDTLGTSSNLVATQKLVNDTKINLDNSVRAVDIKANTAQSTADKKRDKNDFDFEKAGEYGGINIISRNAEIPVMYVTNQNGKMHFVGRDFDKKNIFNIRMPAMSGTVALTSDVPAVSQSTGSSTTSVMSQKAVTDRLNAIESGHGLGYGQSWVDVTSERAMGTTYTNNTGKPICLSMQLKMGGASGASAQIKINGTVAQKIFLSSSSNSYSTSSIIVPPNSSYSLSVDSGLPEIVFLCELR